MRVIRQNVRQLVELKDIEDGTMFMYTHRDCSDEVFVSIGKTPHDNAVIAACMIGGGGGIIELPKITGVYPVTELRVTY